jgi:hypothetical protein
MNVWRGRKRHTNQKGSGKKINQENQGKERILNEDLIL